MKYNMKNLKGQKFGRLLVLNSTDKRRDDCIVWKCICDCGNIVEVSSKRLINNINMSCGCLQKERQKYSMNKLHDAQLIDNTNIDLIKKRTANKNSKSKVRGVHFCNSKQKWIAKINIQKKHIYLGAFKNKEDAIKARKAAEEKYFKPILDKYNNQEKSDSLK